MTCCCGDSPGPLSCRWRVSRPHTGHVEVGKLWTCGMLKHIYPDSTPHHACTVLPVMVHQVLTQVAVQPTQLPTQHAGTRPHNTENGKGVCQGKGHTHVTRCAHLVQVKRPSWGRKMARRHPPTAHLPPCPYPTHQRGYCSMTQVRLAQHIGALAGSAGGVTLECH